MPEQVARRVLQNASALIAGDTAVVEVHAGMGSPVPAASTSAKKRVNAGMARPDMSEWPRPTVVQKTTGFAPEHVVKRLQTSPSRGSSGCHGAWIAALSYVVSQPFMIPTRLSA